MKVALVTTPTSLRSQVGERARNLLPHLAGHFELEAFVAHEHAGGSVGEVPARSVRDLAEPSFDRILYLVGDEAEHAFMLPLIRRVGGTVALHAWELGDLARAAYPSLGHSGWRARLAALREGGVRAARSGAHSPLNRSVVRFADAFIVHEQELKRRILVERNAATPVGVVAASTEGEGDWSLVAAEYARFLEACPPHRAVRKSLIATAIDSADRARLEREAERRSHVE